MQLRTDLKLPADKTPFENIPLRSLKTYNTQLPEKTQKKKVTDHSLVKSKCNTGTPDGHSQGEPLQINASRLNESVRGHPYHQLGDFFHRRVTDEFLDGGVMHLHTYLQRNNVYLTHSEHSFSITE